ncbi:Uncharacterised protein [Mycobacteroides abscessus subsp. abscessus]|nr:Uncharacterised protein [Mycobacteroides abscessus subsp. abscessus]
MTTLDSHLDKDLPADNHSPASPSYEDHAASVRFAGFWMRFWAYLADLIVIGS